MSRQRILYFVKFVAGFTGVTGATIGGVYVTKPDLLVGPTMELRRRSLGFKDGYLKLDDGFVYHYAEKGKPQKDLPTLIMLHGFTGNLHAAMPVVKYMPKDSHIIAIDAPGHGKTQHISDKDLQTEGMAKRLNQFMKEKNLSGSSVHLIGWAMGGNIAGFYAAQYPDGLALLTIACPGMHTPVMKEAARKSLEGDKSILMPDKDEASRRKLYKILMSKNYDFPKPVVDYLENNKLKRRDDHIKVFDNLLQYFAKPDNDYVQQFKYIKVPTQIIWGEKDGLVHVDGADILVKALGPAAKRRDIVPDCGHAFYAEEPRTLANLITAFHADYRNHGDEWQRKQRKTSNISTVIISNPVNL